MSADHKSVADVARRMAEAEVPYVGFLNETLARLPRVNLGDPIRCPQCASEHVLEDPSVAATGQVMLFYHCRGQLYVGAVEGRNIIGVKPDVASGEGGRMESKPMCWSCWHALEDPRVPTRLRNPSAQTCWRCGTETESGIYYLVEKPSGR